MTKAIRQMQWGCGIFLLLLANITQASHSELQLRNFTPTVKTMKIGLQGAKSVMPHLEQVYDLISQVLQSSKLHVVRVPTTEDPIISMVIPVVENLDIQVSMPTPDDDNVQSYIFNLRTKLTGQRETNKTFTYFPNDTDILYQTLQDYFVELLNLEVSTDMPVQTNNQLTDDINQKNTIEYNAPSTDDIDSHPVISNVLNTHQRVVALPIENIQLTPEKAESLNQQIEPKQPVSSQKEIELRNLTPAVKSVEIRLRGSVREQAVLDDIHTMVSDILKTSRLSVIRVPVVKDAPTTPAIKLYEHLEIIIQANSPEEDHQPYLIDISFQEKDSTQNKQQQSFEYSKKNASQFHEQLRAYMSEHINLSPRLTTQ